MPKLTRSTLALGLLVAVFFLRASGVDDNDPKLVRWRMHQIVKDISHTVETSFYDPKLNGVDWKASVEIAHQQIDKADHTGQMITAITALLTRLNDSHTVFIPPLRTQHAIFGFDAKPFREEIRVCDLMPKGPADTAGLQIGDRILAVNDFAATRNNIDIMLTYFRFLDPIRELTLLIERGQHTQIVKVEAQLRSDLPKQMAHVYDTYARERAKESEPIAKDYDGGIVYLRFPSFEVRPQDAGNFIAKASHAHAIILDLRENRGGRVDTLEEVAGHLHSQRGKLADIIGRDQKISLEVKPRKANLTAPLFVLVDSSSASASEMLARYIQLERRGTIVGDRTSGRVNVARIVPGSVGSVYTIYYGLEITVGRAVMADGQGLEGQGVVPDEPCVPTSDDLRAAKDPCLDRALELARVGTSAEKLTSSAK